ncbi:hypothetical protein [Schumannella luteola]
MAARKRPWLAWLPAVILSVVIVGVLVVAGVLIRGGLGQPTPKPTEGQVTELNWSSFTEAGLEYIRSSRDVRIDLSRPPVEAAPIGLEPDATLVLERIDNLDVQLDYDLILNGGGEGAGGLRLTASEIRITTVGGLLTSVEADLVDVLPFRQALDRFERESESFGWSLDRDAIFAMVEEATRAGEPYEVTAGPSDRVGLTLSATAFCDTSGYCALTYTAAPAG